MLKLLLGIIKWTALMLGLVVIGMVVFEKYGEWRKVHDVPPGMKKTESVVSNGVSTIRDEIADFPEPARKWTNQGIEKCEEVAGMSTGLFAGITSSHSTGEQYNDWINRLEEIRDQLHE